MHMHNINNIDINLTYWHIKKKYTIEMHWFKNEWSVKEDSVPFYRNITLDNWYSKWLYKKVYFKLSSFIWWTEKSRCHWRGRQHLQINNKGQDRFESLPRSTGAQYYSNEWPVVVWRLQIVWTLLNNFSKSTRSLWNDSIILVDKEFHYDIDYVEEVD